MGESNLPTPERKSFDALGSLLGVTGPLRLLPQGSAPKPHIIIKRDYSKGGEADGETSRNVARFCFVAGKKFTINKGQPLLFAVACPTDRDGKSLLCDDNTFLLEADLANDSQDDDRISNVPVEGEKAHRQASPNIEALPLKMRKSLTRTKAYASYIGDDVPHSSGFPGYPSTVTSSPSRVYASASVQTDLAPFDSPLQTINTPKIHISPHLSPLRDIDKSPVQLPSPVSADHTREIVSNEIDHFDDEETDNLSRVERSLSPMDLSSDSSSPNVSPAAKHDALLEQNVASSFLDLPSEETKPPEEQMSAGCANDQIAIWINDPRRSSPELCDTLSSHVAVQEPKYLSQDISEDGVEGNEVASASVTADASDSRQGLLLKREAIEDLGEQATVENAVASSSRLQTHAHAYDAKDIPIGPRAMRRDLSPTISSRKPSLIAPDFVKSVQSSIKGTWETSPTPTPYIPASTSSNPLGIRPSSSIHVSQRVAPKAPRSLLATASTFTSAPSKKPVVVGAKWSAARSSSSTTSISNASLSASTSSLTSSLSSLPSSLLTSPIVPTAPGPTPKANLSQILPYASPSPPPPETDPPPPPPPPPQTSVSGSKWKRICDMDERPSINAVPAAESEIRINLLKRPHECLTTTVEAKPVSQRSLLERLEDRPWATRPKPGTLPGFVRAEVKPPRAFPAVQSFLKVHPPHSASSQSVPKLAGALSKYPQSLMHPLPAKPVIPKPAMTGSSYRPGLKRERSTERSESKRAAPHTDWPATQPACDHRLQFADMGGSDAGVLKIMFNADGTLIALLCADQTVRVWNNKAAASTELAKLCHISDIVSACWIDDASVMTLCADGSINVWSPGPENEWKPAKLLTAPEMAISIKDKTFCLAYTKGRIAVSMPSAVKVWLLISDTWQSQRDIVRSGVTAIRFVQDGNALIGGCRDGVLWYCEVPNGTIRVHAFMTKKRPILSIELHPTGQYLLVSEDGGQTHLISLRANENKGSKERTYTSEKIQAMAQISKGYPAVFATKGQAVLYGTVNGCALVWDRKKGTIVYGLKHPDGDPVQAAATFDGRPGVEGWMITGTKQGRLFWWPQPVAAVPTHSASGAGTPDDSRKRQKVT